MKPNKPVILYIPDLFINELDKYLKTNPPNFKYQIVYFYYVVHFLTIKKLAHKNDEYIQINAKYLQSITIWNINSYVRILINGEFIKVENYVKGLKSKGYKLNPDFVKGISEIEIEPNTKLFNKIIKTSRRKKAHYSRLDFFLQEMKNKFMSLDFDYDAARKWIKTAPHDEVKKYSYLSSIKQLQDKRFRYFKRNSTNQRLDTNLTNLKSEIRQFIKGDFISIDLKNSQPFFLSQLLNNIINITHSTLCYRNRFLDEYVTFGIRTLHSVSLINQKGKNSDLVNLRLFEKSVLKGKLYDDFIKKYPENITRKQVKNIMFKVLFSRNVVYKNNIRFIPFKKEKEVFANVFPSVYKSVEVLKSKDHRRLAIYLQKLESYIFIDCIAKRLVEAGIIPLTLHDSVIIETENYHKALSVIKNVFLNNFGVIPSFHIEKIKTTQKQLYNG